MLTWIFGLVYALVLVRRGFAAVPLWNQCGGQGWTGETTCVPNATCTVINQWYHQCIPGAASTSASSSSTTTSIPTSSSTTTPIPTSTSISTTSLPGSSTTTSRNPGATQVPTGSLQEIRNFGTNPTNVKFFIYVPAGVSANPAIVVVAHYCGGSASAMFTGTPWRQYADSGKYIIIYPQSPGTGGSTCWDVHSPETLKHDAGGDSLGIVSSVRWTLSNFNADAKRVFITGISSGAMMTNVLLGAYPDVFAAGSAWAGVPYSCFAGASTWSDACARGQLIKSGAEWGAAVRNGYPGFTGTRPKMQTWHGTNDETLNYNNFKEQIKQWTNVFGVSESPSSTTQNYAQNGWTRTDYGPNFMAVSAQGVSHSISYQGAPVKAWFGLP